MRQLRPFRDADFDITAEIINAAAEAYRGVIPADLWHEPYMSREHLQREIEAGVAFQVLEEAGVVLGVMGIQPVRDVHLIRHAYVRPRQQRGGVGSALIAHLTAGSPRRLLVGTWAAATWAIAFYQWNGFVLHPPARAAQLLREYWSIPERQIETSVVLELPR